MDMSYVITVLLTAHYLYKDNRAAYIEPSNGKYMITLVCLKFLNGGVEIRLIIDSNANKIRRLSYLKDSDMQFNG